MAAQINRDEVHSGYIDFGKNEGRNLRLQNLGADISSPVNGLIFYHTAGKIRAYLNGVWQDMATMSDVTAQGISSAIVDAKGDIIVATADNTVVRKAVGVNGTILVADSTDGTGLVWRVLADGDIPSLIARDAEVTAAIAAHAAIAVLDGDAAGGGLAGTFPSPTIAANAISNAQVAAAAAIARSKLDFGSGLVNADIATGAGIVYTKLNLSSAIVNADVSASAAIDATKIAFSPAANIAATNVQAAIQEAVTDLTAAITAATEGKAWKDPVRVITQGNIANILTGAPNVVDGSTLLVGDRVLAGSQTTGGENGIYTVTTVGTGANGVWARSADMDIAAEATNATVLVEEGTNGKGDTYTQTATIATLGTTAMVWVKSGEGNTVYTADGTTIVLTGSQFGVPAGGITATQLAAAIAGAGLTGGAGSALAVGAGTGISVAADTVGIAAGGVTGTELNASVAGAGLTGGGGSALAVGAGAGISVAADTVAIDTAVVVRKFAAALVGGAQTEVITHNLGTRDVQATVYLNSSAFGVEIFDIFNTTTNTITVGVASGQTIPATTYRVVVFG